MPKRGSANRKKLTLARAKNLLRGSNRPSLTISAVRSRMSPSDFDGLIDWLANNVFLRSKYIADSFPKSAGAGVRFSTPSLLTEAKEFQWARGLIANDSSRLREYVASLQQLESLAFSRRPEDVLGCVDDIESDFGQSIWTIKTRLAFLQMSGGLEAQKEFAQSVKQENDFVGLVAYLTHQISIRNEPTTTIARFRLQTEKQLLSSKLSAPLDALLRVELGLWGGGIPRPETLLCETGRLTAIDRYEVFVRVLALVDHSIPPSRSVSRALSMGVEEIGDPRLTSLQSRLGLGGVPADCFDDGFEGVVREISKERGSSVADVLTKALRARPSSSTLIATAALFESQNPLGSLDPIPGLQQELIRLISETVSAKDLETDLPKLDKLLSNIDSLPVAAELRSFVFTECSGLASYDPVEAEGVRRLGWVKRGEDFESRRSMLCDSGILAEGASKAETALSKLRDALGNDALEPRAKWASALVADSRSYYQVRGRTALVKAFVYRGQLGEAARHIAIRCIEVGRVETPPVMTTLLEAVAANGVSGLSKQIAIPVAFDLFHRFISGRFDNQRRFCYEDFVLANGVKRPSQLKPMIVEPDRTLWVYFLFRVCVESVMDVSTEFSSSRELATERLAICRLLVELAPERASEFQGEIKDLVRRLMLEERLPQIERSKIYVDLAGIKQALMTSLREPYRRYMEFPRHTADEALLDVLHKAGEEVERGNIDALLLLQVPKNERTALFTAMVEDAISVFLNDPEFGLDVFLSVRIRHGTLSGQLRSPLEDQHLITQRDEQADVYRNNSFWLDQVQMWGGSNRKKLKEGLDEVSREFDALIQKINKEWLQVESGSTNEGLFAFGANEHLVAILELELPSDASLDVFVDTLIEVLWAALGQRLDDIRGKMRDEAKTEAQEMLNKLESKASALPEIEPIPLLSAIRSARTELQNTFDRVTEWFRLPKDTASDPFLISDAVQIAVETAKTPERHLHDEISIVGDEFRFGGSKLSSFVDIFFILLENIVRHSGLEGTIPVEVEVVFEEHQVGIVVRNSLGPKMDKAALARRFEDRMEAIRNDSDPTPVSSEGGTGFLKVSRILRRDFAPPTSLSAGLVDGNVEVELTMTVVRREEYEDPAD